jgi:hypothetical protein
MEFAATSESSRWSARRHRGATQTPAWCPCGYPILADMDDSVVIELSDLTWGGLRTDRPLGWHPYTLKTPISVEAFRLDVPAGYFVAWTDSSDGSYAAGCYVINVATCDRLGRQLDRAGSVARKCVTDDPWVVFMNGVRDSATKVAERAAARSPQQRAAARAAVVQGVHAL